jgi:short-subunit dehydrogenase
VGVASSSHRPLVTALVNVLVTGASSGIGAALAVALSNRGGTVGLVGRQQAKLDKVMAQCTAACHGWAVDLGDLAVARALALEAWDRFGHLDVIVNNAAVPKRRAADALTADEVEATMRVNFLSPVEMTLAVLDRMLARGSGVIVNVSSFGGRAGILHEAAYCASKFALSGWSEALAMDLDGTGVRVRLITPGPIDTDIWDRPGEDPPVFVPPLEPPSVVADAIIAAIEGDKFETYVPDLSSIVTMKHDDIDAYIKMNAQLSKS